MGLKNLIPRETEEQAAVIEWWGWKCKAWNIPAHLLYHIPNEGTGSAARGRIQKKQGLRAGAPDLCLAVARGGYHGLYIEMKRKNGCTSLEQRIFQEDLTAQGYKAVTCWQAQQAQDAITAYMLET